jgi:arsenate reductase-like glutaredoxin family protein
MSTVNVILFPSRRILEPVPKLWNTTIESHRAAVRDAILDAMVENPILIERPLVETEKGVRLCRPQDKVREIL